MMGEDKTIAFVLEQGCCADIQLMSIWLQAAKHYESEMTFEQYKSALLWFNSYINDSFQDDLTKGINDD